MWNAVLIDDEPWALIGFRKLFPWSEYDFCVQREFTDSQKALEYILEENPDVVFTDIRMPELSGLDLMREARTRKMNTDFVILSGYGEFEYAQEALQQGAFDYRLKPLDKATAQTLLENLRAHLTEKAAYLSEPTSFEPAPSSNLQFCKLLSYVQAHYTEEIYLRSLAGQFYLNVTYCSELFKKATGKNFSDYINHLRIAKAKRLLLTGVDTAEEISRETGFRDYYYFNRVFKKYTGLSPSQYRRERGMEKNDEAQ